MERKEAREGDEGKVIAVEQEEWKRKRCEWSKEDEM